MLWYRQDVHILWSWGSVGPVLSYLRPTTRVWRKTCSDAVHMLQFWLSLNGTVREISLTCEWRVLLRSATGRSAMGICTCRLRVQRTRDKFFWHVRIFRALFAEAAIHFEERTTWVFVSLGVGFFVVAVLVTSVPKNGEVLVFLFSEQYVFVNTNWVLDNVWTRVGWKTCSALC